MPAAEFLQNHLGSFAIAGIVLLIAMCLWSYEMYTEAKMAGVIGVVLFVWGVIITRAYPQTLNLDDGTAETARDL